MRSTFDFIGSSDSSEGEVNHDLVSLAVLKLELGITGTSEDELLQARIARESKIIADACNRVFAYGSAIETFFFGPGEGLRPEQTLTLKLFPANEIDSIAINDASDSSDYILDRESGRVWFEGLQWGLIPSFDVWGGMTVSVAYSGGYVLPDQAPALLQLAAIEAVRDRRIWLASGRDPTVRDIADGESRVSFFSEPTRTGVLSPGVLALLKPYRELVAV